MVTSLYPLWEQKNLSRDVEAGRYFLPGSATGARETIVTSTLAAEPQYLMRMPMPSAWHVWAAVFTAGFFLILTVQAYWPAVVSGVLAIYCVMAWCWTMDRPVKRKTADIGAGIHVPTYASGPSSHGWWAMVIVLVVAGMVAALNGFSYVFLWSRNPQLWAPPPGLASFAGGLAAYAIGAALVTGSPFVQRRAGRKAAALATLMMVAGIGAIGAGWGVDFAAWWGVGLRPQASAHGASVYSFLGWQGFFVAICGLMALYAFLRAVTGQVKPERPTTFQLIALFAGFSAAHGAGAMLLVRLFPGG